MGLSRNTAKQTAMSSTAAVSDLLQKKSIGQRVTELNLDRWPIIKGRIKPPCVEATCLEVPGGGEICTKAIEGPVRYLDDEAYADLHDGIFWPNNNASAYWEGCFQIDWMLGRAWCAILE